MNSEFELFKGTSFSDLMRDIYHNSKNRENSIKNTIYEINLFKRFIKIRYFNENLFKVVNLF